MEYFKTALKVLNKIKTYFLFIIIGILLVIGHFKNNKITKLSEELALEPQIEYVYNTTIDTVKIDSIIPVEVVKWYPKLTIDTLYQPLELTTADSSDIAEAYKGLYAQFAETKIYKDTLKNDSIAFIQLNEKVQYNSVFDREFIYLDKTPIIYITQPPKHIYTTSIVGGLETGNDGIAVGIGIITKRNMFLKVSYNPSTQGYMLGGYFSVFNFKSKK